MGANILEWTLEIHKIAKPTGGLAFTDRHVVRSLDEVSPEFDEIRDR